MPRGQIGPYPAPAGEPFALDGGRLSLESDSTQVYYLSAYGDALKAAQAYVADRNRTITSNAPWPTAWTAYLSPLTQTPQNPITNNCAQCATGQNTGACAGCG